MKQLFYRNIPNLKEISKTQETYRKIKLQCNVPKEFRSWETAFKNEFIYMYSKQLINGILQVLYHSNIVLYNVTINVIIIYNISNWVCIRQNFIDMSYPQASFSAL